MTTQAPDTHSVMVGPGDQYSIEAGDMGWAKNRMDHEKRFCVGVFPSFARALAMKEHYEATGHAEEEAENDAD